MNIEEAKDILRVLVKNLMGRKFDFAGRNAI
jgi:hypothetical protein